MPRRKIERTEEEQKEYEDRKRQKNAERQRQYRLQKKLLSQNTVPTENILPTNESSSTQEQLIEINNFPQPSYTQSEVNSPRVNKSTDNANVKLKGYSDIDMNNLHVNDIAENYIGKLNIPCIHCDAKHFMAERVKGKRKDSFCDCCGHGNVHLDPLPDPPEILRSLFDGSHPNSSDFYNNIRCYNNSFAFASFNANLVNFNERRPGPYCFKIQGQIYYQVNTSFYPAVEDNPTYGQLFIIDEEQALNQRLNIFSHLNENILRSLDETMREYNIFAQTYEMMSEELNKQKESNPETPSELQLLFTLKEGVDKHRYNFRRVNEVAAIFSTTADGDIPESYVTIRDKRTKTLQNVSTMDQNVEPWIYPLFYPHGSQGWHRNIMCVNSQTRVTRLAYSRFRMAIRNDFNLFIMGRRLFQQWTVDSYVKIEKDRLTYHKNNQKKLKVDTYTSLKNYLQTTADNTGCALGKMTILPCTFTGSPRNMLNHYHDAMAIVRKFGKPDIFLTMTCNPNWDEIRENLLPNQQPSDRPDLVTRVFNIKKDYLIDLIYRQQYFGEVAAYIYVIEFQKRGLPHIHMLITLKNSSKIDTPEAVDKYISAEIPDPNENPQLHEIVVNNMIHGPCGSWCLNNGICSKCYPKNFQNETTMNENGYPSYKRRDTGMTYEKPGGYIIDNRNVVPYSPKLLKYLNCHMNVEVVSTVKAVKYIYKYVYKGNDLAAVIVQEEGQNVLEHDEIKNFIESRYVSSIEACWRILTKPLQEKSHTVIRLPVHLPNEHTVILQDVSDKNKLSAALDQVTMLIEYFKLNAKDPDARKYVYSEIPHFYVYKKNVIDNKNVYTWEPRQSHFNTIGRMYSVSPAQTELFHLRILLLSVKGATSFDNLKTVNGEIQPTFAAACLALGLTVNDEEWKRAMTEATTWMMPYQLRCLFVRILVHCQPTYPNELWDEFKNSMSEDFARSHSLLQSQKMAYDQIQNMLKDHNYNEFHITDMDSIESLINADEQIPPEQYLQTGLSMYNKLNNTQKQIVDEILNAVDINNVDDLQTCFFIDGPGGSGKTFIYKTLYYLIKGRNKKVNTMAFTGIAATLLPEGKTVHKTLGLPVPLFSDSSSNIKSQSEEGNLLKKVDVFIWDEAPMAPRYALEIMDRTLKYIMQNNLLFGGKIIILGGDFRQLLPIKDKGTRSESVNLSIKFSHLWKHFRKYALTENMRVLAEEKEFAKFVLKVGNGTLNDNDNNIDVPPCLVASSDSNVVEDIYGELLRNREFKKAANCAILSARNVDVTEINNQVIELLEKRTERVYKSVDTVDTSNDNGALGESILSEHLNMLSPPNLPPHELRLRRNCIVMLIRNLNIMEGLCNGTRLLVLDFSDHILKCEILTGDKVGNITFINRISIICENVYPFTFTRRQFPVKMAFVMTINKSQGQTLEKIGIDLRRPVFNHGQFYVAISRVRSWDSLKIYLGNNQTKTLTKNYVYKELYS